MIGTEAAIESGMTRTVAAIHEKKEIQVSVIDGVAEGERRRPATRTRLVELFAFERPGFRMGVLEARNRGISVHYIVFSKGYETSS